MSIPSSTVEFVRDGQVVKEVRIDGFQIPLVSSAIIRNFPNSPTEIHLVLLADVIVFTQREMVTP